jgi:glycosyltransferase involved in cell wall biosynthesis
VFIATSEFYRNQLIGSGIVKVMKVSNIFDDTRFHLEEQVMLPDCDSYIVFSYGRHVAYKGFDLLLKAVEKITTDKPVLCVLGGVGELTNELKELAGSNALFTGHLSDGQIAFMHRRADLFLFPSRTEQEAFGITLIEAMYTRNPIVRFKIPNSGVSSVCPPHVCFEVDDISSSALALSIEKALLNPDSAKLKADEAYELFLKEYTYEIFKERLNLLYGS